MASNPNLLIVPIAENGNKNTLPENQGSSGQMSQSTGFPPETSLPLGAGGVAPSREDFNGAFNLLGGVAFYAQKGWVFLYDAGQDYFAGCIVRDSFDGKLYECIADMTAGTIAPHSDTANTYWTLYTSGLSAELIPAFNKRDVITTSGTYTAPVTGWYKITVKGGGGGGGASNRTSSTCGGWGGGEGGTTLAYEYIAAGNTATVVIGAGGTGGVGSTSGGDGGDSSVTINSNTYTGGGGKGGKEGNTANNGAGLGGVGTIHGCPGGTSDTDYSNNGSGSGGTGGGAGGGAPGYGTHQQTTGAGVNGGGGAGGSYPSSGFAGGDGYAWFEYFDGSLNP